MIYINAENVITSFRKLANETKILVVYRYVSFSITSFFFMVSNLSYPFYSKIFIISCLLIASVMFSLLYIINQKSEVRITIVVLMEIIGVSVLLIPTGGMESPFVWYSLNAILVTSMLLDTFSCWLSLSIYLIASVLLTYQIFYYDKMTLQTYFMNQHYLVLCFLLITVLVQMMEKYIKRIQLQSETLAETIQKLETANLKTQEAMNRLMELYQAVHLFTSQIDKQKVINLIIHYTKELAKTNCVLYYSLTLDQNGVMIEEGDSPPFMLKCLENCVSAQLPNLNKELVEVDCCGSMYLLAPVRSVNKLFGMLCIEKSDCEEYKALENGKQLKILTELCASVLEKFELEVVKNHLIVSEEQNRIANEIHDGVLQRLFSISCGLFSLSKRLSQINIGQIDEELGTIRNAIDCGMRELRETIYGMSWKKSGRNAFEDNIQNYFEEVRNLHKVDVTWDVSGNQEFLSIFQKKALYRIVCEGLGNALRHGKAQKIDVILNINCKGSQLIIADNGMGFRIDKETFNRTGLGIKNIRFLAKSVEGTVKFKSKMGAGTRIEVIVPRRTEGTSKEGIV